MSKVHYHLILLLLIAPQILTAQKNERIKYKADELFEFREKGEKIRKLTGNVIFSQDGTTMYCDSSLFYVKKNLMEAFGSVKIVDDSVTITAKRLTYNGKTKTAQLRNDVIYNKGKQNLFTDFLDYNSDTEIANYYNNGRLEDETNTLISEIGYLYSKQEYALFWNQVELDAPDYELETDTLKYFTDTKIATTTGKTLIIDDEGSVLHAKGGEFRTEIDQTDFIVGNIETEEYILEGDELFFDDLNQYYSAKGNVVLTSKEDDVILFGDDGYSDKDGGISKVYGNALMKRIMERDTLFMSADSLISVESEYDSADRILAYNNVKIWKTNLQGIADSASYFLSDSLLYFYDDPVFWNLENQIEGDTIIMEITEDEIKTMTLLQSSFLIAHDSLDNFNQIKGRTMKAYFTQSQIRKIDVNGNGEAIYYVLDDSDPNITKTMGMNRILCSDLTVRFVNKEVDNISFYKRPDAKFIPPHELTDDIQRLKGFNWRDSERPTLDIVLRKEIPASEEFVKDENDPEKPRQPIPSFKLEKEGLSNDKKQLLKKPKREKE